jgi:serine/threonine protein phosphatase PrpC
MIADPKKKFDYQIFTLNTKHIHSFSLSQKGMTRRENQDRFLVKELPEDALLAAVADGMGGESAGYVAAQMAISSLEALPTIQQDKELIFLKELFKKYDKKILQASIKNSDYKNMGTTLITVFIKNQKAYWVHAGDSRLFLLRESRLMQITQDQTFAQFLFDEGEITESELTTHYSRHIIDQCIGHGECEPESGSIPLKKNDMLILSTDGLHKTLSNNKIEIILNADTEKSIKAEKLIQKTIEAKGNDDITIMILDIL